MEYEFLPVKFDNTFHIRDSVYSVLRNAILDGKLKPGQHLVERDIAGQMKVSRTPVREAIQKLENEQLVRHLPRRGVFVAGFTPDDVREIEVIRGALESLCCRLAAAKITAGELDKLQALNQDMLIEEEQGHIDKAIQINRKFHEGLYKAAKSPHLYYFVNTLRGYINRFTMVSYKKPGRIREVYREHEAILACLSRHDGTGAYNAAEKHVEQSSQAFLEMTQ